MLDRLLPFFAVMGVGAVLARLRVLETTHVRGLSRYVLWIGFPALLLQTLSHVRRPEAAEGGWIAAYALGGAVPYLFGWMLGRLRAFGGEVAAALPLACGAGNDAFLTLPLATAIAGPNAARLGGPLVAAAWAALVPAGIAVLHRRATGDGAGRSVALALLNPVAVSSLAGVALMFAGMTPSGVAGEVLARLAVSCVPVGLVAVGAVAAMPLRDDEPAPPWAPVLAASAVRLVLAPLCIGAALLLAGAPREYIALAMLIGGGPTAVTAFIQAQAYNRFATGSARIVAITGAGSLITLAWLATRLAVG